MSPPTTGLGSRSIGDGGAPIVSSDSPATHASGCSCATAATFVCAACRRVLGYCLAERETHIGWAPICDECDDVRDVGNDRAVPCSSGAALLACDNLALLRAAWAGLYGGRVPEGEILRPSEDGR